MGEKKHKKIKITPKEWIDYQNLKMEREQRLLNNNYQLALEQQMQQISRTNTFTFTNQKFAYLPKVCQSCRGILWLENYIIEQVYDRDILHSYISHMGYYGRIMKSHKKIYCYDCWSAKNNI